MIRAFLFVSLVFCIIALILRVGEILRRNQKEDRADPKGSPPAGIIYAYTIAMLPWAKESTRMHWVSYGRGIFFHLGIFSSLILLLLSIISGFVAIPEIIRTAGLLIAGGGFIFGLIGFMDRYTKTNLRALSTLDDYLSVLLVGGLILFSFISLLGVISIEYFHLWAAITFFYLPLSKIRHFIYFFFTRYFFGSHFGRRGIIPHSRMGGIQT